MAQCLSCKAEINAEYVRTLVELAVAHGADLTEMRGFIAEVVSRHGIGVDVPESLWEEWERRHGTR